jgi:WD40 repeat protein
VLRLLGGLWLLGSIVWFLRSFLHLWCFRRLLSHARPAAEELQQQTEDLARRLGLRRCPRVLLVPGSLPPMVWAALGRPRLLFPAGLLGRLDTAGIAALLAHELAHLRRGDHLVRWLELLVCGLYWWCPLVWLARRRLQLHEEECCDAWVVSELDPRARRKRRNRSGWLAGSRPAQRNPSPSARLRSGSVMRRSPVTLAGHTAPVRFIDFSPDGRTLASAGYEPRVRLWDVATGKAQGIIETGMPLNCVLFNPDGKTLAVSEAYVTNRNRPSFVKILDLATKKEKQLLGGHAGAVLQLAFSLDGQLLCSCGGNGSTPIGEINAWDATTGEHRATLHGPTRWIYSLAFGPGGRLVTAAPVNPVDGLLLWNVGPGLPQQTLTGHKAAVACGTFSPDGSLLATGGWDKTVRLWDTARGKLLATLKGHTEGIRSVRFLEGGRTLASASEDHTIKLWDVVNRSERMTLRGHTLGVYSLAVGLAQRQ